MKNILITNPLKDILHLRLNDEYKKNALSFELISNLIEEIELAQIKDSYKVIIIASSGNVFSSGHDLQEIKNARNESDQGQGFFKELFLLCSRLMQTIVGCHIPVIAEIDGIATAAGCQLVASCDLAIASESSQFATPGVNIGLFCSTPMVALSRNVSKKNAMKMLLTGEMIDSVEAKRIGLINDYCQKDKLSDEVFKLAKIIASKSNETIKIGKKAFYEQTELDLEEAYKFTSEIMAKNLLDYDAIEGINAFLDKRKPNWKK
tara:strand:+ start:107 stop:895 length:789 start_codon:yes stop_codon:yes gene_type:complete